MVRCGGSSAVSEMEVIVDEEQGSSATERVLFGGTLSNTGDINESTDVKESGESDCGGGGLRLARFANVFERVVRAVPRSESSTKLVTNGAVMSQVRKMAWRVRSCARTEGFGAACVHILERDLLRECACAMMRARVVDS